MRSEGKNPGHTNACALKKGGGIFVKAFKRERPTRNIESSSEMRTILHQSRGNPKPKRGDGPSYPCFNQYGAFFSSEALKKKRLTAG